MISKKRLAKENDIKEANTASRSKKEINHAKDDCHVSLPSESDPESDLLSHRLFIPLFFERALLYFPYDEYWILHPSSLIKDLRSSSANRDRQRAA